MVKYLALLVFLLLVLAFGVRPAVRLALRREVRRVLRRARAQWIQHGHAQLDISSRNKNDYHDF